MTSTQTSGPFLTALRIQENNRQAIANEMAARALQIRSGLEAFLELYRLSFTELRELGVKVDGKVVAFFDAQKTCYRTRELGAYQNSVYFLAKGGCGAQTELIYATFLWDAIDNTMVVHIGVQRQYPYKSEILEEVSGFWPVGEIFVKAVNHLAPYLYPFEPSKVGETERVSEVGEAFSV